MLQIVAGQSDVAETAQDESSDKKDKMTQASKAELIDTEISSKMQQNEMLVKIKQTLIDRYSSQEAF